jgi:hypothetical protein
MSLSLRWPTSSGQPLKLRWINFHTCPHCLTNNRPALLERVNPESPVISRSDGINFHLVLGCEPIGYHPRRPGEYESLSAGFWYVHEENCGLTETVVVLLQNRIPGGSSLSRILNAVADRLYEKLKKAPMLERAYEFEDGRLHRV